ncbi:MAG: hypothetical protein PHO15_01955 [Eubacteriales bacterium]|nr:hypothetical protein [Eubacteriales bacterium]
MRVWAKLKIEDRMLKDVIINSDHFGSALVDVCDHFDLTKPIVCDKHLSEIDLFRRTVFYPDDFIESVPFDTLEIEIIVNKKKA